MEACWLTLRVAVDVVVVDIILEVSFVRGRDMVNADQVLAIGRRAAIIYIHVRETKQQPGLYCLLTNTSGLMPSIGIHQLHQCDSTDSRKVDVGRNVGEDFTLTGKIRCSLVPPDSRLRIRHVGARS